MFRKYEPPKKQGVEEAKDELMHLMEMRKYALPCTKIQSSFRRMLSSERVGELEDEKIVPKISDLKKLRAMLGDKLKLLPLSTLVPLIQQIFRSRHKERMAELSDWIFESFSTSDPQFSIASSKNNWNFIVKLSQFFAQHLQVDRSSARILNKILIPGCSETPAFFRLLLLHQLSVDYDMLNSAARCLEREILINTENKPTENIRNLLLLNFSVCKLYETIDMGKLPASDRDMTFDQATSLQTFIVDRVLSIPRVAVFIIQDPAFKEIKWKTLLQSYYYSTQECAVDPNASVFLFANIWDIFFNVCLKALSPSELGPMLMTCARVASYLSPRLLETDPSASILEPLNIRALRKQITHFCDISTVSYIFDRVLDYNSETFDLISAQNLCEIYNSFYEKCVNSKHARFVVAGIMGGIAFKKTVAYKLYKVVELFCGLPRFLEVDSLTSHRLGNDLYSFGHILGLFCNAFFTILLISDDQEYPWILPETELIQFTDFLIAFTHRSMFSDNRSPLFEHLQRSISQLLRLLHEFNSRIRFKTDEQFMLPSKALKTLFKNGEKLAKAVQIFPFCIPFNNRVEILYENIQDAKNIYGHRVDVPIVVRRESMMADSIAQLSRIPDIRGRLYIQFVNSFGMQEEGVDAGGLFKEFWTSLSSEAFNPQYGFFSVTADQCLYPNPDSHVFFGSEHLAMFYHVGRILGKAIFEKITVEPKFAEFFLRKMIGKYNFIEDLRSLDHDLYTNLRFLKTYEGDAADLSLTFTVTTVNGEQELVPGGAGIEVTNKNKLEYVHKLADFRLNGQIKGQCQAFFRGFNEIIPTKWICMFTSSEMQTIISGTMEKLDVDDLRKHTNYIDCSGRDKFVKYFWEILERFEPEEQSMLLKFVTSCPRAPLFGFGNLHPVFTISKVSVRKDDVLPTAQTCVNTLRLPTYSSKSVMKNKLLYAIKAGAGFDFQ